MAELETMLELENEGGKASWFELLSTNHQMWKRTLSELHDLFQSRAGVEC
jgi:hypothetical protein